MTKCPGKCNILQEWQKELYFCHVCTLTYRGLSNTVDMIRVDRVNCPVDFCILLRGLRNFLACLVGKGLRVKLVELYKSYEWRKCLSTRWGKQSSGLLHLIKGT